MKNYLNKFLRWAMKYELVVFKYIFLFAAFLKINTDHFWMLMGFSVVFSALYETRNAVTK